MTTGSDTESVGPPAAVMPRTVTRLAPAVGQATCPDFPVADPSTRHPAPSAVQWYWLNAGPPLAVEVAARCAHSTESPRTRGEGS